MTLDLLYLLIGVILGILIGLALPRPWTREAAIHRAEPQGGWFRRHLVGIVMSLVLLFSMLMGGGVFISGYEIHQQGQAAARQTSQQTELRADETTLKATEQQLKDQVACQSAINQALIARARQIAGPTRRAILAPRAFFKVLFPALTAPQLTPEQQAALTPTQERMYEAHAHRVLVELITANHAANEAYQHYLDSQQAHPLPPLPDQFCNNPGEPNVPAGH